jgi:probable phosphoglycerate mutase
MRESAAEIYLVRHGETEWNAVHRFQGVLDSPLTGKGVEQAQACGRLLATSVDWVDAMVTSPLGRARQTMQIVSSFGSYPATRFDSRLAEVSLGSWDGLTQYDIDASWPGLLDGSTRYDWYFRSPDGESYDSARARIEAWLGELSGVVVAVTHGLVSRLIRGAYPDLPVDEALALPVPQGVIWRLAEGRIETLHAWAPARPRPSLPCAETTAPAAPPGLRPR